MRQAATARASFLKRSVVGMPDKSCPISAMWMVLMATGRLMSRSNAS
jgi:hypothetical protein